MNLTCCTEAKENDHLFVEPGMAGVSGCCWHCNVLNDIKFCPFCGTPIAIPTAEEAEEAILSAMPTPEQRALAEAFAIEQQRRMRDKYWWPTGYVDIAGRYEWRRYDKLGLLERCFQPDGEDPNESMARLA